MARQQLLWPCKEGKWGLGKTGELIGQGEDVGKTKESGAWRLGASCPGPPPTACDPASPTGIHDP